MTKAYGNISKGRKTTMSQGEQEMRLARMTTYANKRAQKRDDMIAEHAALDDMIDVLNTLLHTRQKQKGAMTVDPRYLAQMKATIARLDREADEIELEIGGLR